MDFECRNCFLGFRQPCPLILSLKLVVTILYLDSWSSSSPAGRRLKSSTIHAAPAKMSSPKVQLSYFEGIQ